jgi:hypothetical protein
MNAFSSNINNRVIRSLAAYGVAFSLAFAGVSATASQSEAGKICYFGECLPGTSMPNPPALKSSDARQGQWTTQTYENMFIVLDKYDNGATFAFVFTKNRMHLALTAPNLMLKKGSQLVAKVDIDGQKFTIDAEVGEDNFVAITDVGNEDMNAITSARLVSFEIEGAKWTFVPAEAAEVVKAASRDK